MLPSPFPQLLFRSLAGGVAPQAEEDGQSPREGMGRRQILFRSAKSARSFLPGAFCSGRAGAGRVFSTGCHIVPFGQSWSVDDPRDRMARGVLSPARTVRREEPGQFLAGLLASGGPASEDGDLHADQKKRFWKGGGKADQGRPSGPCPLRRRKLRASRAGWRENLFSKRFPSPVALLAHSTAGPDRCRAGRLRDRRPDGRGPLRQRPCR